MSPSPYESAYWSKKFFNRSTPTPRQTKPRWPPFGIVFRKTSAGLPHRQQEEERQENSEKASRRKLSRSAQ